MIAFLVSYVAEDGVHARSGVGDEDDGFERGMEERGEGGAVASEERDGCVTEELVGTGGGEGVEGVLVLADWGGHSAEGC